MKQILMIVFMVALYSCESTWFNEYKIKNDTKYQVEIKAFDTDNEFHYKNDTILIEPYSEYAILKALGFHGDYQGIFNGPAIDSVTIVFDKKKIIKQSCEEYIHGSGCEFPRNIMNYNNETDFVKRKRGRFQGQKEYTYTYTITEEDYNL